MERHDFDPVSAVFGLLFVAAALTVMLTDQAVLRLDSRWVWPPVILVAGLMLIGSGMRSQRRPPGERAGEPPCRG